MTLSEQLRRKSVLLDDAQDYTFDPDTAALLRSAADALDRQTWQPIESAKKNQVYLLWCGWKYDIGHFNTGLDKWVENWDHRPIEPTHWMPLPTPPETP